MIVEYHKQKLNQKCQAAYNQMLSSFEMMKMSVDCKGLNQQDIRNTYLAVYNDHPELFYLSYAPRISQTMGFFTSNTTLLIDSIFSQNEVLQYRMAMDRVRKNLAASTRNCTDDAQIEKAVCDYILKNVTYEINNKFNQNAATALVKNKGQCSGIAKAVKYLLDYLDIECIIVDGTANDHSTGNTGPHSWNIVNINGTYYHLDVTFMLGANLSKTQPFNYLYLNYSDTQMASNHQWDRKIYPACNVSTQPQTPRQQYQNTQPSTPQPRYQIPQPSMPQPQYQVPQPSMPQSQRSTNSYHTQSAPYGGKVISSYAEFKREMGKVYDRQLTKLDFTSRIPESDTQRLVDTLLNEAMDEAKTRNIGFSINVSVTGVNVSVEIDWK